MAAMAVHASERRCLCRENTREGLEQGCLSGSVRTNDADDLTSVDVKVDIREHSLIGILLDDRIDTQHNSIVCLFGAARSFHRKSYITLDRSIWRDQVESSVHAQSP